MEDPLDSTARHEGSFGYYINDRFRSLWNREVLLHVKRERVRVEKD